MRYVLKNCRQKVTHAFLILAIKTSLNIVTDKVNYNKLDIHLHTYIHINYTSLSKAYREMCRTNQSYLLSTQMPL